MTIYELIQELSKYDADTEVKFHLKGSFDTNVVAEFDRENEDDTQEVTVTAEIDDDWDYDNICDYESSRHRSGLVNPYIVIDLEH